MVRVLEDIPCSQCNEGYKASDILYVDGTRLFGVCMGCKKRLIKNGILDIENVRFERTYERD